MSERLPEITDEPDESIKQELAELRIALDNSQIPPKAVDCNLLIATWNIRYFGDLTQKWRSSQNDIPKRDLQSLLCIGEILSRFDVIAIQEVRSNLKAFRHLMKWLGNDWQFLITDVTRGDRGNGERLAFIFDTRKVQLSGLACELVLPWEDPENPPQQFARTPFAVGFKSGGKTFILVTLHVLYGEAPVNRIPELEAIAQWLREWALDLNSWDHNLITLGDFNINRQGDPLFETFYSTGLYTPKDLNRVPRTIFSTDADPQNYKFYDQIAWFTGENGVPTLSLEYRCGGYFDFLGNVLRDRNLSPFSLSFHISDHYPLWVEFDTRDLPE